MLYWKSKKFKKVPPPVFTTLGVLAFLSLGVFFGVGSWNQNLYVQVNPSSFRGIANVSGEEESNIYSISLDGLNESPRKSLFNNATVEKEEDIFKVYLGSFLIPDNSTASFKFICQSYSFLELTFTALGVTVSGEEGVMIVRSPCLSEKENFIGPILFPLKELRKNASKKSFEFQDKKIFIHFYDVSFSLVSHWLLTSVKFFNSPEDEGLILSYEIDKVNPFELDFSQ